MREADFPSEGDTERRQEWAPATCEDGCQLWREDLLRPGAGIGHPISLPRRPQLFFDFLCGRSTGVLVKRQRGERDKGEEANPFSPEASRDGCMGRLPGCRL